MEASRISKIATSPKRPPAQVELLPVSPDIALQEYRLAFQNESVHMPEVSLRYLIFLVLSGAPEDEVKAFALQVRSELNSQRLQLFLRQNGVGINTAD